MTEGHPDKVCDRISDAVLDAVLAKDSEGRVACETCCTTDTVFIAGEITSKVDVDIEGIARRVLRDIGYTGGASGFDADTCKVMVYVHKQSPDIAMGTIPFILPDGKTQVTVEYEGDGKPQRIDTIVISTQHTDGSLPMLMHPLVENVITPVLKEARQYLPWLDIDTYDLYINPTGRFVQGGPAADTGLTGRKIIVDTYGGYFSHGGGAFSGKDPTKVDRSAAYMARYMAKNLVAAGLATKVQVQLAYAIGVAQPVSLRVDSYGTGKISDEKMTELLRETCDMTPAGIIRKLDLRRPIYADTAANGHFGIESRPWEQTDLADKLRQLAGI